MMDSRQATATLTVTRGPEVGERYDIGATTVTIGRYGECDIQVRDTWVSRWHARVSWNGIEYVIEDLGSTNGTYVNGQRVGAPRALRSGERLQLGERVEFVFQVGVSVSSSEVAVSSGIRPSPGSRASPSQAMPTFSKSIAEQKGTAHQRQRVGVWVLAALICLLILITGGGIYSLLSDGGKEPAPAATQQGAAPEPTDKPKRVMYFCGIDRCRDSGAYGQLLFQDKINVWSGPDPDRGAVKRQAKHQEKVLVVQERRVSEGPGSLWFELEDGGWANDFWLTEEPCDEGNLEQYSFTACWEGEY